MNREERKEQTQFDNMLKRYSAALLEVKAVPNRKYQPPEKPATIKHNKQNQN